MVLTGKLGSEHRTREGGVSCCVVHDAHSRRVAGWSIDTHQASSLVTNALSMGLTKRTPTTGTVIHSDHGTRFTCWSVTERVRQAGLAPSMGLLGTPTTTRSSSRSGADCRPNCSTGRSGAPGSSSPLHSSNTWKSSTTAPEGTAPSGCSRPSTTRTSSGGPPVWPDSHLAGPAAGGQISWTDKRGTFRPIPTCWISTGPTRQRVVGPPDESGPLRPYAGSVPTTDPRRLAKSSSAPGAATGVRSVNPDASAVPGADVRRLTPIGHSVSVGARSGEPALKRREGIAADDASGGGARSGDRWHRPGRLR